MNRFIYVILTAFFLISQTAFAADVTTFRWGWPVAPLLATGQTTSYHADDDGDLELGVAHRHTVLTTGQYSGTTNITINGKTEATSNACVQNEKTGNMFHRAVIQANIGPAADGKLFWEQYTLVGETCTCNAGAKTFTADAGTPFSATALCIGRKFTVLGSALGNNATFTVTGITTSVITVSEVVTDEASIPLDFATVDDLIWDLADQANANSLAGYTDWRIPNRNELESLLITLDVGGSSPSLDQTAFPSAPQDYHWTSTAYSLSATLVWCVRFNLAYGYQKDKKTEKCLVRLVRN